MDERSIISQKNKLAAYKIICMYKHILTKNTKQPSPWRSFVFIETQDYNGLRAKVVDGADAAPANFQLIFNGLVNVHYSLAGATFALAWAVVGRCHLCGNIKISAYVPSLDMCSQRGSKNQNNHSD